MLAAIRREKAADVDVPAELAGTVDALQEEICKLQWEDVNLEEGIIVIRDPKGSSDRGTPNRISQIF